MQELEPHGQGTPKRGLPNTMYYAAAAQTVSRLISLPTHHKAVADCWCHALHRHGVAQLVPPHGQGQQPEVAGGGALIEVERVILVSYEYIRKLGTPILRDNRATSLSLET